MGDKKDKAKDDFVLTRDEVIRRRNKVSHTKSESPLVKLKEVLEETDDKQRFVGDIMFWKYFEDIDVDRVRDSGSVEFMNLRVMCVETFFYVLLLLTFTIYVNSMQSMEVYEARQEQINYWSGCESNDVCAIREVHGHNSFWHWMTTELVPNAFTEYDVDQPCAASLQTSWGSWNDFTLTDCPRFFGPTMSNILLGSIRVRQMRVKKNEGCQVSSLYKHIYPDCYGRYTVSAQDKDDYYAKYSPHYLRSAFMWSDKHRTQQIPAKGELNTYGADGFMFDLPTNKTESLMMLHDLWTWHWVDKSTRAVIIEISMMNVNVNVIVNSRIIFEFGPTGSTYSTVASDAAQVLFLTQPSLGTHSARVIYAFTILVTAGFASYLAWVSYIFWMTCVQNGSGGFFSTVWNRYLGYGWNLVDIIIQILFWAHFGFRMECFRASKAEPNLDPHVVGHPEFFMPFMKVLRNISGANQTLALLAMAMWIKVFKYLSMIAYFRTLVRIVEHCAKKLVLFAALLVLVYFAFGVCFFVGFGGVDERFSTFIGSFLVLFFLMVDGFMLELQWFLPGEPSMMPFLFLCYILVIYFVIINIFVAIVLDTWATTKHLRAIRKETENPMKVYVWTALHAFWGTVRHKHQPKDEELEPKDLSIQLKALPGIVRRRYVERKRHMQRIADENFEGLNLFPGLDLKGAQGEGTLSDWMLPRSTEVTEGMGNDAEKKPMPIFDIPAKILNVEVRHQELQRLMDDDESLKILLGTPSAVDVIRTFKGMPLDGEQPPMNEKVKAALNGLTAAIQDLEGDDFGVSRNAQRLVHKLLQMPYMATQELDERSRKTLVECNRPGNKDEVLRILSGIKHNIEINQATEGLQRNVFKKLDGFEMMEDENKEVLAGLAKAIFELEKNKEERASKEAKEEVHKLMRMPLMTTHLLPEDHVVLKRCHRPENKPQVVAILKGIKDKLESSTLENMKVPHVEAIAKVTKEMSGAMTEVKHQFRRQLTGIIEATAGLFEHLTDLTKSMNAVREQNDAIMKVCKLNQEDMEMMHG